MSWFEKLMPSRISTEKRTRSVPQGVWMKCAECDEQLYRKDLLDKRSLKAPGSAWKEADTAAPSLERAKLAS